MDTILENILLGIALAAPIGPAGIAVMQSGLSFGFTRALLTGIGITLADTTYLLVVFFGLSSFMELPAVKMILWVLGVFVLMYLGYQSIQGALKGIALERQEAAPGRNPVLYGYMVNMSNPIAVVFWIGIFGSMLEKAEGQSKIVVLLSSSTILIGILMWHVTMSMVSHWGKKYLNDKLVRSISVVAGVALMLFAVRFAYNVVRLIVE